MWYNYAMQHQGMHLKIRQMGKIKNKNKTTSKWKFLKDLTEPYFGLIM